MEKLKGLVKLAVLVCTGVFLSSCSSDYNINLTSESLTSSSPITGEIPPNPTLPGESPGGISSGHFDLDTATQTYPFSDGSRDKHTHEYDDKYDVLGADYFSLQDGHENIDTVIASGSQRFVLIIANAQLSAGAILEINGSAQMAVDYQSSLDYSNLQTYVLGTPAARSDEIQLTSLKIYFAPGILALNGLIGTQTSCVRDNDAGALGEYRNGALMIQALDIDNANFAIDVDLGVADISSGGGLLYESSIFYHHSSGCYL